MRGGPDAEPGRCRGTASADGASTVAGNLGEFKWLKLRWKLRLWQECTPAVKTLAAIMNEPHAPYAARVAAAEALLDRGWGKPRQSHEAEITHRYVIEIPALMDNATWEAEALEHEPDKLQ
jgi:hypothetical protein